MGGQRRTGRCLREHGRLAGAACVGGERRDPSAASEGVGGHAPPVHRGTDDRRADRPPGHVLQGFLGAVRLDAPWRSASDVQRAGAVGAGAACLPEAGAGLCGALHGGGLRRAELRSAAQDHQVDDQWQPRPDAPQGDVSRLGWGSVRRLEVRRAAWRGQLRAIPRALSGIHRRRRRSLPQSRRHHAAAQRVSRGQRAEVQALARRVHGRVAGADEAERRHHPELRGTRWHHRRARREVVEQRLRLGLQSGESSHRATRGSQPDSSGDGRIRQRDARHRRSEVRRCVARDDRRGQLPYPHGRWARRVSDDARRRRLVWLADGALECGRARAVVLVDEARGSSAHRAQCLG